MTYARVNIWKHATMATLSSDKNETEAARSCCVYLEDRRDICWQKSGLRGHPSTVGLSIHAM